MKDIRLTFLFGLLLFVFSSNAQDLGSYSQGQLIELALDAELHRDYRSAADFYDAYLDESPSKTNYRYKLAESYRLSNQYKKAISEYETVLSSKQIKKYPLCKFHLANMFIATNNCPKGIELLSDFRKEYRGEKEERKYRRLAKFTIEGCEAEKREGENFLVQALSTDINGSHMEASPIFLDEKTLVFNSLKGSSSESYSEEQLELKKRKFYTAKNEGGQWMSDSEWMNESLEQDGLELANGAFSLDRDRFYYTLCGEDQNRKVKCDIYFVSRKDEGWSKAKKLPEEVSSKKFTETQVAIGLDEKNREVLYFVSDRDEGKGGLDIWYTVYDKKKGVFKTPRNCGSKINSVGDELTPFVNPNNLKLYFSSNGHPGYGQFDVFESQGLRSKWEEPINLGTTINSSSDELYYALSPKGNSGFFASNRNYEGKSSTCCDDLFYFIDPDFVSVDFTAKVEDEEGNGVSNADYQLFQKSDSSDERYLIKSGKTNDAGEIDIDLEPNKNYSLVVKKEDFFTIDSEIKSPNSTSNSILEKNLKMKRITKESIAIENIYYEFDKSNLTAESKESIKKTILKILEVNPQLIVEIGSHTDGKGTEAYNRSLSQSRAESVVKFLISAGIPKQNLVAKGYGESRPIEPNENVDGSDNPEGRAKNRRTEFRVVGSVDYLEDDDDY